MLLHLLTPDQQDAFFRIAQLLIHADGSANEAEIDLLETAALEAQIGALPPPASSVAELAGSLGVRGDSPSARAMLFELAGLAVVDGLHEHERELLAETSAALGVDSEGLARILDVAQRTVAVQREALELVAAA